MSELHCNKLQVKHAVCVHCPLQANLAVQEGRLSVAMGELRVAQAQLDDKQRELDEVQAMYDAAMREKQTLLDNAEACRRKMQAASALINGLGGEKERWTAQSKEFQSQIGRYSAYAVATCHTRSQYSMLLLVSTQDHILHMYVTYARRVRTYICTYIVYVRRLSFCMRVVACDYLS